MPTELLFVRHGETDWNKLGRIQGSDGPGLNETGRSQARDAAEALYAEHQARNITAIYASDLERARETAEIIAQALHLPITFDARLWERAHGKWQGYTVAGLDQDYPDWRSTWRPNSLDGRAPEGESVREMILRVAPLLDEIAERHPDQRVLLVSHGGVIGVLRVLSASPSVHDAVWSRGPENCEIVTMNWPPQTPPDVWMNQEQSTMTNE